MTTREKEFNSLPCMKSFHKRPMIDYERFENLLNFFRVKNMPSKCWSKTIGWKMSEHLHLIVLRQLREIMQSAR